MSEALHIRSKIVEIFRILSDITKAPLINKIATLRVIPRVAIYDQLIAKQ